ncbi:MAG: hypothetical protein ACREMJ_04260 [Gemmatimonadales bacterium]
MTQVDNDAVLGRLERLERENRWLKRVGALALAVALIVGLSAQATRDREILIAEAFVLRDAQGVVHGVLDVTPGGAARLRLGRTDGAGAAELQVARTGTASLSLSGNYQLSAPTVRLEVSPGDFTGLYVEGGSGDGISVGAGPGQPAVVEWTPPDARTGTRARLSSPGVLNLLRWDVGVRAGGEPD